MWNDIKETCRDWFVIVVIIVWFFFLMDIGNKQREHYKALETGNVFTAPDHNDGFALGMYNPGYYKGD